MDVELQQRRLQLLKDFAAAWNRHDLSALSAAMTDDCVFHGAAGELVCGSQFRGREAVAEGYAKLFTAYPDAAWNEDTHFVVGDRGVSEWRFTGTGPDGERVEMLGCDLFRFEGDRISLKDSYRKQRT